MPRYNGGDITLGQAIERLLDAYKLRGKMGQAQLKDRWPEIAGPYIQSKTRRIFMRGSTIYLEVEGSVLKHELQYNQTQLLARIHSLAPAVHATAVVLL